MATYHASVKVGPRGKAASHAAYLAREGKYADLRSGEVLELAESGNMPTWAANAPAYFWHAADAHERANGNAYREFELALPRELTPDQRADLVRSFVAQELGERHAYTFAIHNPIAALDGGEQPHAHVMFSDRKRDGIERDPEQYFRRYNAKVPERGGCQKEQGSTAATQSERYAERKEQLIALRARWAESTNAHLEQHGHSARVDHRSLVERGIDRTPEPHFGGRGVRELVYRGDVSRLLEQRRAEGELERAQVEVRTSMLDLSGDLSAARRDRDQRTAEDTAMVRETAERDRLAHLPAAALREEIQRLRPPPLDVAVAARPEVVSMQRLVAELDAQQQASRQAVETAGRESEQWAAAHSTRTRLHELGVVNSPYLAERVAAYDAGTVALVSLRSQREVAEAAAARVRETARREVAQAQAPVLAAVGVLEDLYQAKLKAERVAAEQAREREARVKTFTDLAAKRERGAYGYADAGRAWQALGEGLRDVVDAYNRQGPEGRARGQDHLRGEQGQAWLAQALPARDRGMER